MKKLLLAATMVAALSSFVPRKAPRAVSAYLDSIRHNTAALTAFFSQMPKGGDLHNHYSGAVYAETYIAYVTARDYYMNINTLAVDSVTPKTGIGKDWFRFSQLKAMKQLPVYQQKLMQKWSVKDYNGVSYPSDKQFFETFAGFGIANNNTSRLEAGLLELKNRAVSENVSYIECMFISVPAGPIKPIDTSYNGKLAAAQRTHDTDRVNALLQQMYTTMGEKARAQAADTFNKYIAGIHERLHMDDDGFTMRYMTYVTRVVPAADVFRSLAAAFEAAHGSPLVVGVNIVAPEDNEVSMRDYWLHMQMFRYLHKKLPDVRYSMHAGEMTTGLVPPEQLTWHINAAVHMAGAQRIGHGVDMATERNCYDLLHYMAAQKVPVEINLVSNEFILKVKNDQHPISLYRQFKVPIVISTDDPGILRTDFTQQYVLLADRYPDISYEEIKQYVYNSIDYSFIKEARVKTKLKADLDKRFAEFEEKIMAIR